MQELKVTSQNLSFLSTLGPFLTPFGPLGTRRGFCPKKFLQCKTTYENKHCGKISEKSNGRLIGNKPDGRTDGTDYYSPFPTNVGGLKILSRIFIQKMKRNKKHFGIFFENFLSGGHKSLCRSSHFWKVSEKSNGQIKSYGAKHAIFSHFGHFCPNLTPFSAPKPPSK